MKHDWRTFKQLGGTFCVKCAIKKSKRNAKADDCKPKTLELVAPVRIGEQHG